MNQNGRRSIWIWIWIGCVALLSIPLVFLVDRLAKKEPEIILWSDLQYGDRKNQDISIRLIRSTENALKHTMIPEIDFKDEPFLDCVDALEKAMNENKAGSDTFRIVLEDSVSAVNVPIKLRLKNVPAAEALRYVTSLANLKYRVTSDGEVEIVPLGSKNPVEEGWFDPGPFPFEDVDPLAKKIDVRAGLESAGVDFPDGAVADFYPSKGLLWVRNTRDQMELIDAYFSSVCYFPEPTWRDQIYHYWMVLTDGYPSVPSSSPVSLPVSPDPFGGGASSSQSEPDPFGGGASSGQSEPDPFGGGTSSRRSEPDPFK